MFHAVGTYQQRVDGVSKVAYLVAIQTIRPKIMK